MAKEPSPKDSEIEIKVKIQSAKILLAFLKSKAKFKYKTTQVEEYFVPKHRNFLKTKPIAEWLRLRQSGDKATINYKNWHYDKKTGKSIYCDEFETQIGDLDQLRKIFKALDFQSVVKVSKIRTVWSYKDYEISLDTVKSLGDFVEIEYKSTNNEKVEPKEVTQEMVNFLKDVGCGKIHRNYQGYPFLLLFPSQAKYELQ